MGAMTEGTRATRELERQAAAIRADRERLKAEAADLEDRTKAWLSKAPSDVSIRELADQVGLSHQRVAQILPGRAARGRRGKAASARD